MTPIELQSWVYRHGITPQALNELLALFNATDQHVESNHESGKSESAVQADVRLKASKKGWLLWRNNVGALLDKRGIPIRYGLANETKAMNKNTKSSDLIGIRPILIQPRHVGTTIGQFVAIETKKAGWKFKGDDHENAQLKFHKIVVSKGGHASFASGVDII